MKWFLRTLWLCVALEFVGVAVYINEWLQQPVPPRPDLSHYHPVTSVEIRTHEQLVLDDGSANNWLELGKLYLFVGLFPEAEFCCRQAARQETSFSASYWWGVSLNQLGETSRAIDAFGAARDATRDRDGNDAKGRCWYGIGRNYLRQEDALNAEKAFRAGIGYAPCRRQLIRILVRSKRASEALPMLDQLIARNPTENCYYQLRARARTQSGDVKGAAEDWAHVERATSHLRTDAIIEELQIEAGNVGLYREFQEATKLMLTDPHRAVDRLQELLDADWRLELASLLVDAQLQIGNAQQAADLLEEMIKRDGASPGRLAQLARCNQMLNNHKRAFALRKRIAKIRNLESVHADLAVDYHRRNQPELARKHRALAHLTAGISRYRKNALSEARSELERAVKIDPQLANAWYYLAECQRALDLPQKAEMAYRRCLEVDEDHGRARLRLLQLQAPVLR